MSGMVTNNSYFKKASIIIIIIIIPILGSFSTGIFMFSNISLNLQRYI